MSISKQITKDADIHVFKTEYLRPLTDAEAELLADLVFFHSSVKQIQK